MGALSASVLSRDWARLRRGWRLPGRPRPRPHPAADAGEFPAAARRAFHPAWLLPPLLALVAMPLGAASADNDPDPPSKQEVERSKERAAERAEKLKDVRSKLENARARRKKLTAKAERLTREYYRQQVQLESARRRHQEARQRLATAEQSLRRARDSLAELAAQRYRMAGGMHRVGALLAANSLHDLIARRNTLQVLANERRSKLARVRSARIVADVLRKQARAALADQRQATRRAQRARQAAQRAAEQQRAAVERTRRLKSKRQQRLEQARSRAHRLEQKREEHLQRRRQRARRQARQARQEQQPRDPAQRAAEQVARITGNCGSGADSVDGYANGLIPPRALCPLPQDGHLLRADAAAAFARLNAGYADRFGRPICVTDSYRSLGVQRRLEVVKPALAAEPGTSKHGMGVAVDLCGGINRYGTAPHEWMRANAPDYGWVLPAWARAGGSKPEPWHWEYTG